MNQDILILLNKIEKNKRIKELLCYCPLEILKQWKLVSFKKGDTLFEQGKVYDSFHIILEGKVDIYVRSSNCKKYSQAIYTPGDVIGELEIFTRKPYVCSLQALNDGMLITLLRTDFFNWLKIDNHFNQKMLERFSSVYCVMAEKAASDILYTLQQRLCTHILELCQHQGSNERKNEKVKIIINKNQLADNFSVTLRSINRTLRELKEKDIINVNGNHITIIDMKLLEKLANKIN